MLPVEYHILPQRGLIDHYQELAEPFTKTCMQTAGLHLLTSGEPARKFIVALERIISKRMRLLCLVLSGGAWVGPSRRSHTLKQLASSLAEDFRTSVLSASSLRIDFASPIRG
ncbi:predicted protein [Histoplasma capsulatum var. duboisii H88]|uniref:Predicted protein n=2 Tax=Ajellomyces capsulatus TaxID=5037 RepID=F0U4W0_AJEC8|nr:predicted protein [Histoplasma capsulatum H143]EGC41214.1 predicted protein [Histoplasma capsulatum var. duboisii H88]